MNARGLRNPVSHKNKGMSESCYKNILFEVKFCS